jgi:hypothetical protein
MSQNHMQSPTPERLLDAHTDITAPTGPVEVNSDDKRGVLWVNVSGVCVLRVCQIQHLVLEPNSELLDFVEYIARSSTGLFRAEANKLLRKYGRKAVPLSS